MNSTQAIKQPVSPDAGHFVGTKQCRAEQQRDADSQGNAAFNNPHLDQSGTRRANADEE